MLRHLFSLVLPVTVLILVPLAIEDEFRLAPPRLSIAGVLLLLAGLSLFVLTLSLFVRVGKGTLAPWDPTRQLVTAGPYAYVRNPMILSVFCMLVGEALLFASRSIGVWAALFIVINTLYFVLSEEPGLCRRFGGKYEEYRQHVPRWIPRRTPWRPGPRA